MPRLKLNQPFRVVITEKDKAMMKGNALHFGKPYGVFFTSSGAAYYEEVNPNAQYHYVYRTDEETGLPLDVRATAEGKKRARKNRKEDK